MENDILETMILGLIQCELKDEIDISRQVELAKQIIKVLKTQKHKEVIWIKQSI